MAQKLQQQLKDLGSKLESPPASKDALLKLLKQAITVLSEMDQSPSMSILESMQPFLKAIVKPELLKHQDKDVKLLVASCLCEITRITAPEAPYSDDILKDIFRLIVGTFSGLNAINGPSFGRRVVILETLARYRSCVVMLDLECDDLVNELFRTFLNVVRDDHPENVLTAMRTIMFVLIDESEDIQEDLLFILLSMLGRNKKDVNGAARKLAMNVIERCAAKLGPAVKQFLISSMTGESSSNCHIDYHEVIYDLYCCSPEILSGVVPFLTGELLNDQSEARLKAVKLVGELFAFPVSAVSEPFQSMFAEFLKRLTDRVVEVRMSVLDYVKRCLLSSPSRPEASQIFAALCDRLLDYDENVRKQVVGVVSDVACYDLNSVPAETTKQVAERLRDKSLLVKKYTLDRLAEIYRVYCLRCKEGCENEYNWIPGKILRCFYDKDFRSDAIEAILCGPLFPTEFTVKDMIEHWISILARLDKVEIKALEKILEQKQRLQQEMHKYLSLRQTYKDTDTTDYQKKVILLFRVMSRFFIDPVKAEEGFLALDQLKDANVWKILPNLLDPNTSSHQAHAIQVDLLKILGEKHRLFDFLNVLSVKCSYMLFSKEHVKEILSELASPECADNTESCLSCVNILVILASYSPLLFVGSEEDLLQLLKDENEITKEGILHVLARAGGIIREQLASASSSVDLMLERLCLEGTRRQAKYAVHALAAITKDDGLRSLSVLYKRLVDMMEEKAHLPTVLQSLGCIAQTAMAVFETRESEVMEYIKSKILQLSNKGQVKMKARWRDPSELCLLKIFGIKTLVKSYLPVKDAHLRGGIDSLIEILRNMLSFGELSEELESSSVDKAHLKLASAKAILRLSRYWENKIPAHVFLLALRTVEINYRQARKLFLSKVHQYIKDRVLDAKYACAFLLDIFASQHPEVEEDKHNLADVIQMCRQVKARQLSLQSDTNPSLPYPEYILPYLVHVLAHHPLCPNFDECRDVKAVEPLYRVLYLFLSMVVRGDDDAMPEVNNADKEKDIIPAVISILQCVKQSEDVVDPEKSKNSHAISELGLLIIKRLAKSSDCQGANESVPLPSTLYRSIDLKVDNAEAVDSWTWLADDSIVAHFESLTMDVNGTVHLEMPQDDVLEDIEIEANEMPLGKLIKRIKSQKNKSKAAVKGNSALDEIKNDVDVLKVVREINLDNQGALTKTEPNNGCDNNLNSETRNGEEIHSKKRKGSDAKSTVIPKRRRSLSARNTSRCSSSKSAKASVKGSLRRPLQGENEPSASDLLVSPIKKKPGNHGCEQSGDEKDIEEADISDQKGPKSVGEDKCGSIHNDNSSIGSAKKRKRKSIAGLAKCTSNESGGHTTDLVDCRIKVWWPMDKRFYEGMVKSYDPDKKKHVVLYDDGDVEVLRLEKERWELVADDHRPKKKSPPKVISAKKKSRLSDGSETTESAKRGGRSSAVKGKRAQKKNFKHEKKVVLHGKNAAASEEVENRSEISNVEPTVSSDIDELEDGDLRQDLLKDVPASGACDVAGKSGIEGLGDGDDAGTDSENSFEDPKSSPESDKRRVVEDSPLDSHASDVKKSHHVDTIIERPSQEEFDGKPSQEEFNDKEQKDEAGAKHRSHAADASNAGDGEDADDKPLSMWKQQLGKSRRMK